MKYGYIYIKMAILSALFGIVMFFSKMHKFAWGDVPMFNNGAAFNDVWYFSLEAFSMACFSSAFAYVGTCMLNNFSDSVLCWIVKYLAIWFAFINISRSIFHLITYDKISIFEMAADLLLTLYTGYRAILWYRKNMTHVGSRTSMERR